MIYCENCEHVEFTSRKSVTWRWLCRKFPRRPSGAVSPTLMDVDPPYHRCVEANAFNNCAEFSPQGAKNVTSEA